MALFGQQTASSTLLSTSTLSALSNSSSLLDGVDVDIIEEIIERAPRSAATFPPIHRAYGLVLEEQ
jgi:protein SFI1